MKQTLHDGILSEMRQSNSKCARYVKETEILLNIRDIMYKREIVFFSFLRKRLSCFANCSTQEKRYYSRIKAMTE